MTGSIGVLRPENGRIDAYAYARAGLVGNPSDGYHGKTIAFIMRNFAARVTLVESEQVRIEPAARDSMVFDSPSDLCQHVRRYGYYGGLRLLTATVKRFHLHCERHGISTHDRNFTLRYQSDVPSHVGLAGSSALITATFRVLMGHYDVWIEPAELANLTLAVETEELGIPAGLQDRVVQAYEGLVFMDFDRAWFERQGYGEYESLDSALLPDLYVAYSTRFAEGTEVFHNDIRTRFDSGEPAVVDAMHEWAELAQSTRDLLVAGRGGEIGPLLDRNFDLRLAIYQVAPANIAMVEAARKVGASAKFTGSGGAIVGLYEGERMFEALERSLRELGVAVLKPQVEAVS